MENASKALIIAGSILVAILLIAMGVKVFTSTNGTTKEVEGTMKTVEMTTFNSKFTKYVGTGKSLIDVKALANTVISSNAVNSLRKVAFNNKTGANEINGVISTYSNNTLYTIMVEYDENGEYISKITVEANVG